MIPDDLLASHATFDATSDDAAPATDDLRLIVAHLTARVYTLEQAIEDMRSAPVTAVPPPAASAIPGMISVGSEPPVHARQAADGALPHVPKRSLEDRLGSQIFNRIGIVAILIGSTWFLKLAMDNHWIGPLGRILIGLIAGAGLIGWSERFRRQEFTAFSYSLKAIGTGVLYLSLWASFQLYHLLPAEIAFGLMLLVTFWNAWMAWSQESEVLAAYAISGAFSTPALLSIGGNHQIFLFSYLFTIDVATLALIRLAALRPKSSSRSWSRLILAALPATVLYFIDWYGHYFTANQLVSTSVFITLFFAAFFTVPFRFLTEADSKKSTTQAELIADVLIPLANASFAALAFYFVFENSGTIPISHGPL